VYADSKGGCGTATTGGVGNLNGPGPVLVKNTTTAFDGLRDHLQRSTFQGRDLQLTDVSRIVLMLSWPLDWASM
jgi:hypothetical protein